MPKVSGTWRFNETLNWPAEYGSRNCDLGFSVPYDNLTCIELNFRTLTDGGFSLGYYGSHGGTMSSILVYSSSRGWTDDGMRTLKLYETQEMTDEIYEWFTANAVLIPVLNPAAIMIGFLTGARSKEQRAKRMLHDHTYSAEVTAPTCTEKGYTTCTCASCGHRYLSNLVPATGHDYVSEVIDPTTKAQGYTKHTCSRCGDTYKDNYTERLPVACSYNGVELPPLPAYDTTAYPYAFIFTSSSGTTYLYYSNQPFHGYSSVMDLVTNKTDCTMGTYKISDGVWIAGTAPKEYATKAVTTNIPFWANYDVLDVHEQLWCAASEPVPIYE